MEERPASTPPFAGQTMPSAAWSSGGSTSSRPPGIAGIFLPPARAKSRTATQKRFFQAIWLPVTASSIRRPRKASIGRNGAAPATPKPTIQPRCFFRASRIPMVERQVNLQATGAFAKRYHIGSRLASIEVGGKFRNAHKYDDSINYTLTPLDAVGAIPQSTFPSKFTNKNYYGGSYPLGYNISYNDVYAFYATNLANTSHFLSPNDPSAQDFSSQFDLVEKVSAGYVMNSVDIGKARIVAGLRIEGTNLDTIAVDLTATPPVLNVKNSGSYIMVLPSAALRYDMGNVTYIRFAYARD